MELLPLAQFALNSAKNETIAVSSFFANYGFEPKAYQQSKKDNTNVQQSIILVNKLKKLQEQLSKDIEFSNLRIAKYNN